MKVTKTLLTSMYLKQYMGINEICFYLHIGPRTLNRYLKAFGIEKRKPGWYWLKKYKNYD